MALTLQPPPPPRCCREVHELPSEDTSDASHLIASVSSDRSKKSYYVPKADSEHFQPSAALKPSQGGVRYGRCVRGSSILLDVGMRIVNSSAIASFPSNRSSFNPHSYLQRAKAIFPSPRLPVRRECSWVGVLPASSGLHFVLPAITKRRERLLVKVPTCFDFGVASDLLFESLVQPSPGGFSRSDDVA